MFDLVMNRLQAADILNSIGKVEDGQKIFNTVAAVPLSGDVASVQRRRRSDQFIVQLLGWSAEAEAEAAAVTAIDGGRPRGTRTPLGWGAAPDSRRAIYSIQAADLFRCSATEEGHGFCPLSAVAAPLSFQSSCIAY